MLRSLATLSLAAGIFCYAQASTPTARGVEVTPPDEDLGDREQYVGWIGVDTDYLSMEGTKTRWIGVNSEYITEEPTTITVDNSPVVTHVPLEVVASTASADGEGVVAGDVTILLAEKFRAALQEEVKAAAISCGAPAKHRKRQEGFMTCMIRAGQGAAGRGGGAFDLVSQGTWEKFTIELTQTVPEKLKEVILWGGDRVAKNKFRVFVGAIIAAGVGIGMAAEGIEIPPKLKFQGGKLGDSNPTKTDSTTSTTSGCDPSATPNADSPVCTEEKDCKPEKRICTDGKYKGCRCTDWTKEVIEGFYDVAAGDEQQRVLVEAMKNLPDEGSVPPKCFRNSNGDGFDGKPMATPSAWCVCESATSTGIYPTLESQTDPCALATMPTETISITSNTAEFTGQVTSCRWTTPTFTPTVDPFCTCNDDKMHFDLETTTTVEENETKTICIPPETEIPSRPTPDEIPSVDKPKCFNPVNSLDKSTLKSREDADKFADEKCDGLTKGEIPWPENSWIWGPVVETGDPNLTEKLYIQIDTSNVKGKDQCKDKNPHPSQISKENCKRYLMAPIEKCTKDDEQRGGYVEEECMVWWIGLKMV